MITEYTVSIDVSFNFNIVFAAMVENEVVSKDDILNICDHWKSGEDILNPICSIQNTKGPLVALSTANFLESCGIKAESVGMLRGKNEMKKNKILLSLYLFIMFIHT